MPTLAPTVRERLPRGGTRVCIDGLVAGADGDRIQVDDGVARAELRG